MDGRDGRNGDATNYSALLEEGIEGRVGEVVASRVGQPLSGNSKGQGGSVSILLLCGDAKGCAVLVLETGGSSRPIWVSFWVAVMEGRMILSQ